jgi:hypothetical protein
MDCKQVQQRNIADEYLAGRLSAEEADAYESHYFTCDRCLEDLRFRELMAKQLREEGSTLFASEIEAESRDPGTWRERLAEWRDLHLPPGRAWAGGLVAVVAVIIVAVLIVPPHNHPSHLQDLWDPVPHPYLATSLRGGPGASEFRQGMEHYSHGRYREAADWLERSVARGTPEAEVQFYLGVSLLLADDPPGAVQALRAASLQSPAAALYRWYLAQALFEGGRLAEAESELILLTAAEGEYAVAAQTLLETVQSVRYR